jgi:hypothetical protein
MKALLSNMDYVMANDHLAVCYKMASGQDSVRLRTTYFSAYLVYCVILPKQRLRDRPGIKR